MHDVNHEITVVEQHPLAFGQAFTGTRLTLAALEIQVLFDFFGDGQHLAFVRSGGDEHRVGDGQWFGDVEGYEVSGLHTVGRGCGDADGVDGILYCRHIQRSHSGFQPSTTCCVFSE